MNDPEWPQIELLVRREEFEQVEDVLLDAGALSIGVLAADSEEMFEHADSEKWSGEGAAELWSQLKVCALFAKDLDRDALMLITSAALGGLPPGSWSLHSLPDKDWHRAWMDRYEPLPFGQRLWVCPTWKPVPECCEVPILLDPGLAFGTGTHATTAMCLEWLDAYDCSAKRVVDFGCGSGILVIAAMLLGAEVGLAIDNDASALESCSENTRLNNIDEGTLQIMHLDRLEEYVGQYDIVLANILAGPLVELAPQLMSLLQVGGKLILSGILERQVNDVLQAYEPSIFFEPVVCRDGWAMLHGTLHDTLKIGTLR